MRACVAAEKQGIPAVAIISSAFMGQARATARALGMPDLRIAEYPGMILTDSREELRRKIEQHLLPGIVAGLARPLKTAPRPVEPGPRDIVFRGNLSEVEEHFTRNLWTDGMPVIPPTLDRVEEFLKFTPHPPEETIGMLLPENREANVWNVAVNGVMAGCRPEYMPVLLAAVQAVAEPDFRIADAGSTPGWEPLIIVNGPIIKDLDFGFEGGVMRVGRQANTSIGRFLRLFMRNVAGLRTPPGQTDKASIAYTFNVVLAENEDVVAELGWQPFSVDRGFKRGENIVTVQSVIYISPPTYTGGATPLEHLEVMAELIGRRSVANWTGLGVIFGRYHPLIVMSPAVATVIARGGWSKDDVRRYLYENVKTPAGTLEKITRQIGNSSFTLCGEVRENGAPGVYCESEDPERLVPVFLKPEWTGIVVAGDPGRNQSKAYVQNHKQGPPVSKIIELPANWRSMLERRGV